MSVSARQLRLSCVGLHAATNPSIGTRYSGALSATVLEGIHVLSTALLPKTVCSSRRCSSRWISTASISKSCAPKLLASVAIQSTLTITYCTATGGMAIGDRQAVSADRPQAGESTGEGSATVVYGVARFSAIYSVRACLDRVD